MIAIIDYGLGNIGSIHNMLKKLNAGDICFASTPDDINNADRYILPGVGAFDTGMGMLNASGMREALDEQVLGNQKPILGICLGMQMLGRSSEEGKDSGLGYLDFCCRRFQFDNLDLRIPHMGWDYADIKRPNRLTQNPPDHPRFYFVHSYYAVCEDPDDIMFSCGYGFDFAAGVNRNNVYGVQFHPEKSHRFGMWLLRNFIEV